ncbi:MATH domain and coiled-coil domain-containing protein At3g58380-like [Brassica napus]|nr:MATH domain and coiled-coil domain-containing protein At3g58380-like [Brassica napus]
MNVLLELIETLCQLPEKLSDDDLAEASAAVLYLSQVGLKVDWLEEKLEELKEKKKKMYTGKAQLQRMEEELQNLTKKCSDLEDLVKKQNVALSFSDVV